MAKRETGHRQAAQDRAFLRDIIDRQANMLDVASRTNEMLLAALGRAYGQGGSAATTPAKPAVDPLTQQLKTVPSPLPNLEHWDAPDPPEPDDGDGKAEPGGDDG